MATRTETRAVASLEAHPASGRVFGHLDPADFDDLKRDIEARGLRHPLELDAKGRVICGGERLRAITELGWKRTTVLIHDHLVLEEDSLEELLLDNLIRRHLTPRQKYQAGVELEKIEAVRASKRIGGRGHKEEGPDKGQSEEHVARQLGIGRSTFHRLKDVYEHGTEDLQNRLDSGELSVSAAASMARKLSRNGRRPGRTERLDREDPRARLLRMAKLRYEAGRLTKFLDDHALSDFGVHRDEVVGIIQEIVGKLQRFAGSE